MYAAAVALSLPTSDTRYFELLRRAAQRAFIISDMRLRAAGLIRPRRPDLGADFVPVFVDKGELLLFEAPAPFAARWRAQRARVAAAILARASGDIVRRPRLAPETPLVEDEADVDDRDEEDDEPPSNIRFRRSSSVEICRRIVSASSSLGRDKSISDLGLLGTLTQRKIISLAWCHSSYAQTISGHSTNSIGTPASAMRGVIVRGCSARRGFV